jgi:DNA primase
VEQLKQSVNIVDVVESYQLPGFQRKGGGDTQRAVAICPFHDDHNPSLNIDNQRKLYKCFACGAGGDVFNFVKEYDNLGKSEANKMSFGAAVRHVAKEFGDGTSSLQGEAIRGSNRQQRMTEEQRHELQQKQNRIRLANTLAAEFYGKCLVTLPAAGAARQHLRDRHLAPATVRAFAMGYAPDAYFGHDRKRNWGEGSLVEYLRQKGFRPQELIDAGLATRTKRAQWQDVADNDETARQGKVDSHITQTNNTTEPAADDYSTLIDRFRGRLMVPIFDLSGTHVIAFGGRILAAEAESAHSEFKAPKYLNSPESLVFQKKNELFGLHYACQAIREQTQRSTILIVEGYMDAIALWDIGVHEVVASMGTALTMEQLSAAAKAVGSRGE